jgi:hypothetical protein
VLAVPPGDDDEDVDWGGNGDDNGDVGK